VRASTLPLLAGEAFGALDDIYGLIALRRAGGTRDLPADVAELLGRAAAVPSGFAWGDGLRRSVAERLPKVPGPSATGPDTP
ncbi:MAG: hypothetical protein ACRDOO_27245, partial [Actinomadura sp.]